MRTIQDAQESASLITSRWLSCGIFLTCLAVGFTLFVIVAVGGGNLPFQEMMTYGYASITITDQNWENLTEGGVISKSSYRDATHLQVNPSDSPVYLLAQPSISVPCTVEVKIRQIGNSSEAQTGLWWGRDIIGPRYIMTINNNRYAAVWLHDDIDDQIILDRELFPHIRLLGETNILRLDLESRLVSVRVNDEVLAKFDWEAPSVLRFGIYFGPSPTGVTDTIIESIKICSNRY